MPQVKNPFLTILYVYERELSFLVKKSFNPLNKNRGCQGARKDQVAVLDFP